MTTPADDAHREVLKTIRAARRLAKALDRIAESYGEVPPEYRGDLFAAQSQLAAVSHRLDVARDMASEAVT